MPTPDTHDGPVLVTVLGPDYSTSIELIKALLSGAVQAGELAPRDVSDVRSAPSDLGTVRHVSSEKARRWLGWRPRSSARAVTETAESLIALGLVPAAPA
jgi:hypothetical protein